MDVIRFFVDAAVYRREVLEFRTELATAWANGSMPVQRVFELLPINFADPSTRAQLVERGLFSRNGDAFENSGTPQDATFEDNILGMITLKVPEKVTLVYLESEVSITLRNRGDAVRLEIEGLPSELEIHQPLRFIELAIGNANSTFSLVSENGKTLELVGEYPTVSLFSDSIVTFVNALAQNTDNPCWGDEYVINRQSSNKTCLIQKTTEYPIGSRLAGPYRTRSEAEEELDRRKRDGDCL